MAASAGEGEASETSVLRTLSERTAVGGGSTLPEGE